MRRSTSIDQRQREQLDLVRKQGRELERQAADHLAERAALEAQQKAAKKELQRVHVVQLVDLWQAQGRELGRWTQPVLEGKEVRGGSSR